MPDSDDPHHPPADSATLGRQLSECAATLQALRREQEVFARGIAHDLRAPLRTIDSFSALLADSTALDAVAGGHLERIRAASLRMGGLIDALLALSAVNRAELRPEPVDLDLLVEWAVAELQEAEAGRVVQVDAATGLRAQGDERLLRQLIGQLVGNAWKFSRDRDQVQIVLRGDRNDERVHMAVQDRGCGFDMRYADKLFEPFQRLHGPEQGGGNGLGLAIAQRIIGRHAGRIWAESEPGVGSTFHIELPAADHAG